MPIFLTGERELDNVMKLSYIFGLVCLIIAIIVPEWTIGALIYCVLCFLDLLCFKILPKDYLYGISKFNFNYTLLFGVLLGFGFLITKYFFPFLSIFGPSIMLTVMKDLTIFIGVFISPYVEERWRANTYSWFLALFPKLRIGIINVIQAIIFGIFHFFVLGVILSILYNWTDVFNQIWAVSGLLLGTIGFSLNAGRILNRTVNWVANWTGHIIVNFVILVLWAQVFG